MLQHPTIMASLKYILLCLCFPSMSISITELSVSHLKPSFHQNVWLKSHWKKRWIRSSCEPFW
jgi:hypothetical protein